MRTPNFCFTTKKLKLPEDLIDVYPALSTFNYISSPVALPYVITSVASPLRTSSLAYANKKPHYGIDLVSKNTSAKTDVIACTNGIISNYVSPKDGIGTIWIKHKKAPEIAFLYSHVELNHSLQIGDNVSEGQIIGKLLTHNSKYSTGMHLHFSIEAFNPDSSLKRVLVISDTGRYFLNYDLLNVMFNAKSITTSYLSLCHDNSFTTTAINPITQTATFKLTNIGVTEDYKGVEELESLSPEIEKDSALLLGDTVIIPTDIHVMIRDMNTVYPTIRTTGNPMIKSGNSEIEIGLSSIFSDFDKINNKLRPIIAQYIRTPFTLIENKHINKMIISELVPALSLPKGILLTGTEKQVKLEKDLISNLTSGILNGIYNPQTFGVEDLQNMVKDIYPDITAAERRSLVSGVYNDTRPLINWMKEFKEIEYRSGISFEDQPISVILESLSISSIEKFPSSVRVDFGIKLFNYYPYMPQYAFCKTLSDSRNQILNRYKYISNDQNKEKVNYTLSPSISQPYKLFYRNILEEYNQIDLFNEPVTNVIKKVDGDTIDKYYFSYRYNDVPYIDRVFKLLSTQQQNLSDIVNSFKDYISVSEEELIRGIKGLILSMISVVKLYIYEPGNIAKDIINRLRITATANGITMDQKTEKIIVPNLLSLIKNISENKLNTSVYVDKTLDNIITALEKLGENNQGVQSLYTAYTIVKNMATNLLFKDFANLYVYAKKDEVFIENNSKTSITSWNATFSNKFNPIKILQYNVPTYQYLGSNNWEITLNIKTSDMDLIKNLRKMQGRIQYTAATRNRWLALTKGSILPLFISTNESGIFGLLGVDKVIIDFLDIQSIAGSPGSFNIVLRLVQSDFQMNDYEGLYDVRLTTIQDVMDFYTALEKDITQDTDINALPLFLQRIAKKYLETKAEAEDIRKKLQTQKGKLPEEKVKTLL